MRSSISRRKFLALSSLIVPACARGAGVAPSHGLAATPPIDDGDGDRPLPAPRSVATCAAAAGWAAGGTIAMTKKACYPDPFAAGVATCPRLVCATTAGPCTASAPAREDVSEGRTGLPVRLALKLVTADTCAPLAGAVVEIWHAQTSGVYSGITPSPGFCSGGDADAPKHSYFRGTQTTGADGRVNFDTCFPGWYPGRAIHIHFRVAVGAKDFIASQLFFPQSLIDEIFASHVDYLARGVPNTRNANDGVIGGSANFDAYVLDCARMSDGAMLASKLIAIRGSRATPNCSA